MKITLAPSAAMSMFDRFFKGKGKKRASDKPPGAQKRKEPKASPKKAASKKAPGAEPTPAATQEAAAPLDTRPPEEQCGITSDMDQPAIKAQLAKMFRRYNRLASSLDGDARAEAEGMLDLIVQMREKHLG